MTFVVWFGGVPSWGKQNKGNRPSESLMEVGGEPYGGAIPRESSPGYNDANLAPDYGNFGTRSRLMEKRRDWLNSMMHLRVDRSRGPAPHKPLLLLVLLDMAEKGELRERSLQLTPELAFRFSVCWPVVAHRRSQRPDVRLPFHHLSSDGFWAPRLVSGEPSPHRKATSHVELDADFAQFLGSPINRERVRNVLISKYFEPAERIALYALFNMPIPASGDITCDASCGSPETSETKGREARFRLDVVAAYQYTCALTGYRVTTILMVQRSWTPPTSTSFPIPETTTLVTGLP